MFCLRYKMICLGYKMICQRYKMFCQRYTMHLFFGLGSFLTPVFAKPFLGNQGKVNTDTIITSTLIKI